MKLEPIEKGKSGWKKRLVEILILETMSRTTLPNTGWCVWQKIKSEIKHKSYSDGKIICEIMKSLSERGYLEISGSESCSDCGYYYNLVKKAKE